MQIEPSVGEIGIGLFVIGLALYVVLKALVGGWQFIQGHGKIQNKTRYRIDKSKRLTGYMIGAGISVWLAGQVLGMGGQARILDGFGNLTDIERNSSITYDEKFNSFGNPGVDFVRWEGDNMVVGFLDDHVGDGFALHHSLESWDENHLGLYSAPRFGGEVEINFAAKVQEESVEFPSNVFEITVLSGVSRGFSLITEDHGSVTFEAPPRFFDGDVG